MAFGDARVAAVAAELRALKAANDVPMELLASRCGLPVETLFQYLAGLKDLPVNAFVAICEALGADPADVLRRAYPG